jgi:hypothetical protein
MKIAVFGVVAPCRLENYYQTTRCYNPEDSNLQVLDVYFIRQQYPASLHRLTYYESSADFD